MKRGRAVPTRAFVFEMRCGVVGFRGAAEVVGPSRIRHISQATRGTPAQKRPFVAVALAAGVLVLGAVVFVALRTSAPASYAVGDAVQIEWKGSWYPGRIVEVAGSSCRITYDGYSATWEEWVETSRLPRP